MKLNLITFASSLASRDSVFVDHKTLLDSILKKYEVNYIFPEELDKALPDGPTMVFVGSGGVEEMVAANINRLPNYVVLVADGLKNSLAASLEILSWLRLEGRNGRVIHGNTDFMMRDIDDFVMSYDAIKKVHGQRVGVIGKPSGWLIASGVDYKSLLDKWGLEMIDLPLTEVVDNYHRVTNDEVAALADDFINSAIGIKEPSRDEVVKAMRLYIAVKKMCEKYHLNAFTLNCFDLIPQTNTTGCLALALLNQQGIPAGCEGDLQTLITMLIIKAATGQECFMANPSKIVNNDRREMIFAHCTIAPSMTDSYVVRNHYESLSGVAIEGILEPTEMTVVKCGGRSMEHFFISGARLQKCLDNPTMCRTQMQLEMDEPLDYFLQKSIGNHHVIVKGDHRALLSAVFHQLGAKNIQ